MIVYIIYVHFLQFSGYLSAPLEYRRFTAPVGSSVALAVCMRLAATGIKPEPFHNKSNESVI
jgi:hypothetical protein